jgi:ElaB/YqjD/DUF883 family membrane-anchored ribosome-binding protein
MADHSFITLYAHIGSRIRSTLRRGGRWVRALPWTSLAVAFCIGIVLRFIFPNPHVALYCAVDVG